MCTFERDCCLPLLGMGNSSGFINPMLLLLFPGFGQELNNPLNIFFDNYEIEMVEKKKLNPEAVGVWPGIHLWSKTGLAELGKGLTIA